MALATLTVDIVAKLATLQAGFDRAAQIAEANSLRMQKAFSGASRVIGAFGGIAAGLSVGALTAGVQQLVGTLDDLADAAPGVGLTAEQLSQLQINARRFGIQNQDITGAVGRFSQVLDDAKNGSAEASDTVKRLGIDLQALKSGQLTVNQALAQAADRLRTYSDGFEKVALVRDGFGRGGQAFVSFLSEGSEGLRRFAGATPEAIAEAQKLQDQIDKTAAAWERFKLAVGGAVAGGINRLIDPNAGTSLQQQIEALEKTIAITDDLNKRADPNTPWIVRFFGKEKDTKAIDVARERLLLLKGTLEGANSPDRSDGTNAPPARTTTTKKQRDEGAEFLKSLQDQAVAANYTAEEVLRIRAATLNLSDAAEPWIVSLASGREQAEYLRQTQERMLATERARLAVDEEINRAYMAQEKSVDELLRSTESAQDRLARQLADIEKLRSSGALGRAANRLGISELEAEFRLVNKYVDEANQKVETLENSARDLGLIFTSAFEEAVVGGKKLRDVLKSIADDIQRYFARKLITEPLLKSLEKLLPSNIGGGSGGDLFSSFFKLIGLPGFATGIDYVPRDMVARIHKGERVVPAAENARGGYGRGVTLIQHNSFAAGVSRAELAPLLEQTRKATIAELNGMAFGNSPRLAFGRG